MYEDNSNDDTCHSHFIKVLAGQKSLFMQKKTVVWLFNNNERVSTDRIFRVRSKQPQDSDNGKVQ